MTTPSGFHDGAWRRPGAHDRLQTDLLNFLRSLPPTPSGISSETPAHRHIEGEFPIGKPGGDVISFADAAQVLTVGITTMVDLYEVKPRIDNPYAIVRQMKAMLALAEQYIPHADVINVHAVVPCTDPRIGELKALWPRVWAWGTEAWS